ncbi:hypothetical protein LINPERPRIM_LOCUS16431, partial [Linum perenne]
QITNLVHEANKTADFLTNAWHNVDFGSHNFDISSPEFCRLLLYDKLGISSPRAILNNSYAFAAVFHQKIKKIGAAELARTQFWDGELEQFHRLFCKK